ncbi:MAG: dihydroorotase, partial [Betaproteobacteria bacterium]
MKIEIRNGRVIDPKHGIDRKTSLYVAAGKVAAVGDAPEGWHAKRVLDAAGLVVCPGLIDASARLREPGFEYKATLESEVAAAVAGGVTSLACPPDTDPPLDEPGLVQMLKHRARSLNQAHVYPIGALTVGLKGDTHADAALADTQVLLRALQYAATFGYRVWLRPQDVHLARGGVAHDGEVATRLGLPAIPGFAETIALDAIFELVRATGVHVHLARLSTHDGVARVRAAKKAGLPVTCDVAIHHVHLCDVDIGWFNANCHLVPPLRGTRDRAALRAGLIDGTVDLICSDHTPVDDDAKQLPFAEAEPGATAVELLLPLTLKWAKEEKLPLSAALDRITAAPARVLGLDAGQLAPGADADVCVFDPDLHWVVAPSALRSQGKNTPFLGLEVSG